MNGQDPRHVLARRLRELRERRWHRKITQPELARALGGVSVPLISSWESQNNPKIPPLSRLDAYATFFATARSVETEPRLLSLTDLTEAEQRARDDLKRELMGLRNDALRVTGATAQAAEISESLSSGPWRFEDGNNITIVCAQLPADLRAPMPYTDPEDPQYVELYTYSDLDALFELHGHLRATNPTSQIHLRTAQQFVSDDFSTHFIALGGIDWNQATSAVLERLQLPVRQVNDWESDKGPYFEVTTSEGPVKYWPRLEESDGQQVLTEDVALFARAVSPFNRKRIVTICNGMYGRGTYGTVRALTDARFRDRNADYIRQRFEEAESFCLLSRVEVVAGVVVTPDWSLEENRLFEWSSSGSRG